MIRLLPILALLLLFGCAQQEVLEPIDGTVPANVDLSGTWKLRTDMASELRRLQDAIRQTDGVRDSRINRGEVISEELNRAASRSNNSSSRKAGLVHVFLETGSTLKLTQTQYALFISFDRAVVEEYRFGENRMISVGQAQAQRVTGWTDEAMVIETLGKNRMKLTERFQLVNDSRILRREITLRSKKKEEVTLVQEFERID